MLSVVPGCVVRVATLKWNTFVWTPVAVGFGVGLGTDCTEDVAFAMVTSEVGAHYRWGEGWRHSIAGALGLGVGAVLLNDLYAGGAGAAITPSVRYQYRLLENLAFGGGMRAVAVVPAINNYDNGFLMTAFFEVAGVYQPEPEVDATAPNSR